MILVSQLIETLDNVISLCPSRDVSYELLTDHFEVSENVFGA